MKNLTQFLVFIFLAFAVGAEEKILVEANRPLNTYSPNTSMGDHEVYHAKSFKNSHQLFLKDFLKQKTTLHVVTAGPLGGQTSVFLQGLKSEHLLVLIDGVKMNDAASPARGYDFSNLTLDQIEKIEIIKGPEGVLHGGDALGGVIKITTKGHGKNLISKDSLAFNLGVGSYAQKEISASTISAFEKGHVSVGADGQMASGFSAASSEYAGNTENDGFKRGAIKAQVLTRPNTKDRFQVGGQYQVMQNELDRGGGPNQDDINFKLKQSTSMFFANYGHEFSDLISSELKFSMNEQEKRVDNAPDSNLDSTFLFEDYEGIFKKLSLNLPLLMEKGSSVHKLSMALEKEKEQIKVNSISDFGNTSIEGKHESVSSAFMQYGLMRGAWNAGLGARIDQHTRFGAFQTYQTLLNYRNDLIRGEVWVKQGTSFKAPSLYQLYSSFGSLTLEPERSSSYQLGYRRQRVVGELVAFELLFFKNKIDQLIDYDFGSNTYKNIGRLNSSGLEAQVEVADVAGNFARLSHVYTRSLDQERRESLRRPRQANKGKLGKRFQDLEAEIGYQYVGKRPDVDAVTFQRVKMPSYVLFHANLEYLWKKAYRLGLLLDNILDRRYQEIQGQGTAGRNFQLKVGHEF